MKLLAMIIGKCASFFLRLAHRGGSFPGSIALRICPSLFQYFHYDCEIIVITGTNGKTSVSNMIADLFLLDDKKVISNRKGDNLKEGIATAIINRTSIFGHVQGDIMVLEVDELNIPYIMKNLKVTTLVVTNFFRDQLDRSKEMEQLIQKVEQAVVNYPNTLILNGNDPNVVRLQDKAPKATAIFFGAEACSVSQIHTNEASEGKFCPHCNHALTYEFYQYSHIGVFSCHHCEYKTPDISYMAKHICIDDGSFQFEKMQFTSPIQSLYTIYNCMAVIAVASLYNISHEQSNRVFKQVVPPLGRNETLPYKHHLYTLNLVKNPTGANEVLKFIEQDQKDKILMIVLNDNAQDGTDVSWIYDAQFERVLQLTTKMIICSGLRAYDMALRIKYANYEGEIKVMEEYKEAMEYLYDQQSNAHIIATYTALQPVRNCMRRDS